MKPDQPQIRKSAPFGTTQGKEEKQPTVIIVDDDLPVREALSDLILSVGFQPIGFASTRELLDHEVLNSPGCLILDVRMPGTSGLELQKFLVKCGNPKPIIFLTAHSDVPMTVQAMKAGAVDFLTKPVRDQTLIDAVNAAIAIDAKRRAEAALVERNVRRIELLTPREREVLSEVARGRVNKQIAFDFGISEVTVKLHRSNMMRKMEMTSIGELIRAWETLPLTMREIGQRSGH